MLEKLFFLWSRNKTNFSNLETQPGLHELIKQNLWRHKLNPIVRNKSEINLDRSLTWASTPKALGQKCPTLVFSKLEMVWQWNLANIDAILCQVKINCKFSKWRIIFDEVSTTLRNTVKFTIFWYILLTGVVQSCPNNYFRKRWFLLANTTWKWQKVKSYWKKWKKIFGGFFRYDVIQERPWFRVFLTPIFNNFFRTAFKQLENQTLKISSQFSK